MQVLVTGGTGFTGSHLVRRLLERGHRVRVLDHAPGLFHDELKEMGADIRIGTVTDRKAVQSAVDGCEVVHHVAAAFRKINMPKEAYWQVNVDGTREVCDASLAAGVRKLVYCSTQGVHGDVKVAPGNEDSPIAPEDYYQYTKYEGEKVVLEALERGLDATILRPTAIYGPGDPGRFLLIFRRAKSGRFLMFSNGQAYYHPVYVTNLVDLFELAASHPKSRGRVYIAADEHYVHIQDLVRMTGEALGVNVNIVNLPFRPLWLAAVACEAVCTPLGIEPPLFRRRVDWFRQNRAFSIARAKNELGYVPQVDLKTGLGLTARWYLDHKYL